MAALERFCLRWNDFESNLSASFREIRDDGEFFDMTLSVGDQQIQAHKLVLSACSPFFRSVLKQNPHQHPLLYLKGVTFADLQAVLNFIYHGEVSVAQDSLNSFLAVAEELRVKGLTQNSSTNGSAKAATGSSSGSGGGGDWSDKSKDRGSGGNVAHRNSSSGPTVVLPPVKKSDHVSSKSTIRPAPRDHEELDPPSKKLKPGLPSSLGYSVEAYSGSRTQQRPDDDEIQEVPPVKQEPGGPPSDLGQPHRSYDSKVTNVSIGTCYRMLHYLWVDLSWTSVAVPYRPAPEVFFGSYYSNSSSYKK